MYDSACQGKRNNGQQVESTRLGLLVARACLFNVQVQVGMSWQRAAKRLQGFTYSGT